MLVAPNGIGTCYLHWSSSHVGVGSVGRVRGNSMYNVGVVHSQVQYVSVEEIPASFVEKEKEIEMGKEDLAKRPEAVRSKIVEGRVAKTLNELALLEQPYIRDDKILVKDYVKQTVAALGENLQVRRFARFNLGEGLEKRSTDFAAEVAAQTGATKA